MREDAKIRHALVVLSPDLIRPDKPMQSTLIKRAVSLSRKTGCELELFDVCFDNAIEYGLYASGEDLNTERERMTDRSATRVAELATHLRAEGVNVKSEVRWDHPRTDAILRKIDQCGADIVLKQARERSYILGFTTNTDWDLARRSPADVWFVNEATKDIKRVVAAVGNKFGDPSDITKAADFELLRAARAVGNTFGAEIFPVNAYQVPDAGNYATGFTGVPTPVPSSLKHQETRQQALDQHSGAVKALAGHFGIELKNVHISEGHPSDVIPEVAQEVGADLVALGASSIGRIERMVSVVTVEPVLAETDCDILVVRERDGADVPKTTEKPLRGVPNYDLERAITNPGETFDSPHQVSSLPDVSIGLRRRILQAWEYDIRAGMTEENEGGPVTGVDVNALGEIESAKSDLRSMQRETKGRAETRAGM